MKRAPVMAALAMTMMGACAGNVKGPRSEPDGAADSDQLGGEQNGDEQDPTGQNSGSGGTVGTNDRDAGSSTGNDPNAQQPSTPPMVGTPVEAPTVDDHGLPSAPEFTEPIQYVAKPGSVTIYLPSVPGVADYRVFALTPQVKVSVNAGAEHVEGAVISCAGLVQHGQCDPGEAMEQYGPTIRVAACNRDVRAISVAKSVLKQVNLDGLTGKTQVVVEAIDSLCPFPGAFGASHHDVACVYDGQRMTTATYQGKTVSWAKGPASFPIRTEAEIRADYGSLIINGQSPAPTAAGESPWASIGLPAPNKDPKVLRRAVIEVTPSDPAALPEGFDADDFYESFSDPNDQPQRVNESKIVGSAIVVQNPMLFQTKQLSLYSYAADGPQFFVSQGTLRSVLPDLGQAIMASNVVYPKRAFALPSSDSSYIHATFEMPPNSSQRRYWWFHACGAATAGQTIVNGKLPSGAGIVATPGFMNPIEGASISSKGWNCLQIVPRGGSYVGVAGGPYKNSLGGGRPETDLRIVVNKAVDNPTNTQQITGTVSNVSPSQDGSDPQIEGTWLREWDANKKIVGVLLDDQMFVEQRVKFDVYFNRGRIVVYANGVQKLCNDFPKQRLTMAEAAVGIGHVFYHSSVDREDYLREDWLRTGQYQYLHNLPYVDQRSIDNFGVREGVGLPSDFQSGQCYTAK